MFKAKHKFRPYFYAATKVGVSHSSSATIKSELESDFPILQYYLMGFTIMLL